MSSPQPPTGPPTGPPAQPPAGLSVEAVFREEHRRLVATLARQFGDLDLAEDVASEAVEAALVHWSRDGTPTRPGAWLLTTARRRAVDRLRRDTTLAAKLALVWAEVDRAQPQSTGAGALPDDRLELFFSCAHPALSAEEQVALTLRYLAGLTTVEVARAFLVPVETMAKRLTRAKKKVAEARILFRMPQGEELQGRLAGVLAVVYSIFTEGYAATSGPELQRLDLATEAVALARVVHRLLPRQETAGLLALLLLVHARAATRVAADGVALLLAEQDRTRWDRDLVAEGTRLVEESLTGGPPGPYGVQAAIAALHAEAPDVASTDWPQIVALYDVLLALQPSPATQVHRAAAVAMRDGAAAGLDLLDGLADEPRVRALQPFHAARADLLQRLGRTGEAVTAYRAALDLPGTEPERLRLRRRLADLDEPDG